MTSAAPHSPLLPQRGLDLAHPHQGAQVLHLRADLRHVQAAHVVDVLVQPSRLKASSNTTSLVSEDEGRGGRGRESREEEEGTMFDNSD